MEWLAEYLKGDISELYLIALEGFSKDVLEKKILIDKKISDQILSNIHQQVRAPKQVKTVRKMWVKIIIAASVSVALGAGYLFRQQIDNWADPVKYQETVTAKGQIELIELPDGTSIWLNADSKLRYPDKFKGDTREIALLGEAFFKVAHDNSHPFIIHSGKINTTVLGTSFNIRAYNDDKTIKIAVLTGEVGITTPNSAVKHPVMMLTPNMQAVFTKTDQTLVAEKLNDASLIISWRQGELQYRNAPLSDVLADLQRKYNVVIKADKGLLGCRLYADFNNLPLQKVLKLIDALIDSRVVKEGNGYRLKGKGCN